MAQLNPYLKFDGKCREAMAFYQQCIGGELQVQTLGESPVGHLMPAPKDSILHATLQKGSLCLMGSDFHWGETIFDGNGNQICIQCDTAEEISTLFTALSQNGQVTQPISDMPWGAMFGSFIDQYGKHWILNYDKNKAATT